MCEAPLFLKALMVSGGMSCLFPVMSALTKAFASLARNGILSIASAILSPRNEKGIEWILPGPVSKDVCPHSMPEKAAARMTVSLMVRSGRCFRQG